MLSEVLLRVGSSRSELELEPEQEQEQEQVPEISEKNLGMMSALIKHQHVLCAYSALLSYYVGLSLSTRMLPAPAIGFLGVFGGVLGFPHFYNYAEDRPRFRTGVLVSMLCYLFSAGALSTASADAAANLEVIYGPVGLLFSSSVGACLGLLIACRLYGSPTFDRNDPSDEHDQEFHGACGDVEALLLCGFAFTEFTLVLAFLYGLEADASMNQSLAIGLTVGVGMSAAMSIPYLAVHGLMMCTTLFLRRLDERRVIEEKREAMADSPALALEDEQVNIDGEFIIITNGATHSKTSWASSLMGWMKSAPQERPAYLDGSYPPETPVAEARRADIC